MSQPFPGLHPFGEKRDFRRFSPSLPGLLGALEQNGTHQERMLISPPTITEADLLAYLDETLAVERSVLVEQQLREQPALRDDLARLTAGRDQGGHTPGEIWMRERLSCLSREQLENYLRGATSPEWTDYIEFHLQQIACRYCLANLADLKRIGQPAPDRQQQRRYFESSAGMLRPRSKQ